MVPGVTLAQPTVATAGLNQDVRQLIADEIRRQNNAATAAPAATPSTCPDPCGDIKQLQKDVAKLIVVTDKLTAAVENLHQEKARSQNPQ
jgi:hypothetical protein